MAGWYDSLLKLKLYQKTPHLTLPPFFLSLMYLFTLLLPRQMMTWHQKIECTVEYDFILYKILNILSLVFT